MISPDKYTDLISKYSANIINSPLLDLDVETKQVKKQSYDVNADLCKRLGSQNKGRAYH